MLSFTRAWGVGCHLQERGSWGYAYHFFAHLQERSHLCQIGLIISHEYLKDNFHQMQDLVDKMY